MIREVVIRNNHIVEKKIKSPEKGPLVYEPIDCLFQESEKTEQQRKKLKKRKKRKETKKRKKREKKKKRKRKRRVKVPPVATGSCISKPLR